MGKRNPKRRTAPQPWEPFTERVVSEQMAPYFDAVYRNNRYQVFVRGVQMPPGTLGIPDGRIVHLSIKRVDKNPLRDWRHLQRIKNELIGEECEAVELYPAESRLVDEANQYHLFVVPDRSYRFPFGDNERQVGGPEEAAAMGAKQRPFDEAVL